MTTRAAPNIASTRRLGIPVLTLLMSACTHAQRGPDVADNPQGPAATSTDTAPAAAFMTALADHCGKAYAGRIVANQPASTTPDPFEGKALVMHVRDCSRMPEAVRIPFHVGDDHSRTWVLTRTDTGLRLKHDHRHQDGSPDATTMYGGDTANAGSPSRQAFPVDAESIAMFNAQGMQASTRNTWAMQIDRSTRFVYELSRPDGRLFQLEFDLTRPVATPPAPWGSE